MFTKLSEDEDVSQIFVERLEHDIRRLYHEYYKFPQKMIFTEAKIILTGRPTVIYVENHSNSKLEIIVI